LQIFFNWYTVSRLRFHVYDKNLRPLRGQQKITSDHSTGQKKLRASLSVLIYKEGQEFLNINICPWLYSPCGPWPLFQFLNLYTVSRTPWGISPSQGPLPTHRTTQTQNKSTQTSIPQVGFEPTVPMFERVKTVHALERAATVFDKDLI
jgi:hypothetical protein